MVLCTEKDWEKHLEPVAVSEDGNVSTFRLEADQPFLYFKPCLVEGGTAHWSVGPNKLALMTERDARVSYPFFFSPAVARAYRVNHPVLGEHPFEETPGSPNQMEVHSK
jgi:hypothetical protein